jgi:ATP-dependent RNA helicase DeaD
MSSHKKLEEIASRMDFRTIPEILAAADTPIDRGHHLALAAARGSGVECVYALAVDRVCDAEGGLQALVLAPSRDRASAVALAVQRALGGAGLRAGVAPLRSDGSLDVEAASVQCLVARPSLLLPEIRLGRLSLSGLDLLVLDGVADLREMDEWDSVEPLLDTLDADARRIAVTRRIDADFLELVQRQLPRGRRWPDVAFAEAGTPAPDPVEAGYPERIEVAVGATPEERIGNLVAAIGSRREVRVRCRSTSAVPEVRAVLESAGFVRQEPGEDWDVVAARPDGAADSGTTSVWFGLPLALEALAAGPADHFVAIVDSSHAAQLELLAARAGSQVRFLPGSLPVSELDAVSRFRSLVRSRIEKGGTDAELLVLEPLVREFGTARVAAALSNLLRRSAGGGSTMRPWADVEAASREGEHAARPAPRATGVAPSGTAHRGARGSWSRVFIGAGNRDSVKVGDLVGAITGETGIAGAQIGKIEIRGSFSLVEIDSQVVDRVIERLNGTTIRGREVTVKPDRGG